MPAPKCLAIVLCESVVEDTRTRNKCLLNTFNRITASSLPLFRKFTLFASFTDGIGNVPVKIRIKHDDKDVIQDFNGVMEFKTKLMIVDMVVDMHAVFAHEGWYSMQLLYAGEIVERRLNVVTLGLPESPGLEKPL